MSTKPVVIGITGTPGCGKTSLCKAVYESLGEEVCKYLNVGELIKERELYSEWDDEMNCSIFDEKLVRKEIRKEIKSAGEKKCILIDFHSLGFLSDKLVDHVVVLQTDTKILAERLKQRGYDEKKIDENIQCEIFMECYVECTETFEPEKVKQRTSDSIEDAERNLAYLVSLVVYVPFHF
jgi:adenylate kinase